MFYPTPVNNCRSREFIYCSEVLVQVKASELTLLIFYYRKTDQNEYLKNMLPLYLDRNIKSCSLLRN